MYQRVCLLVCFVLLSLPFANRGAAQCECPVENTTIIGHRGSGTNGAGQPPENTLASVDAAYAEGAAMVEIDAQLTADGVLVLMHDGTVSRTTDGSGCVSELTAAEIATLDADGAPVPTLDELLQAGTGGVNIEIKISEGGGCAAQDLDATADAVVASVRAHGTGRDIIVSSFDLGVLQRLRVADPSIPIGYLSLDPTGIDVAAAEGFEAVHLLAVAATARNVAQAHAAGIEVNVWTVNNPGPVDRVLRMGVDGVITDTATEALAARVAFCDAHTCPMDGGPGGSDAGSGGGSGGGCSISATPYSPAGLLAVALALWWLRRSSRA